MNPSYNLARVTTATVGTGTITLASAVSGFLTFAQAGVPDGAKITYGIQDGANSEVGWGVYTASGTTLTRNVRRSTGAGNTAAISLSGSAQVYITGLAEEQITAAPDVGAAPHVDLDFVNNLFWSAPYNPGNPLIVTRASAAYIDTVAGVWSQVAANVLRRSNKGALIEEARTNSTKNNSMQGASAGSPGTLPTGWAAANTIGVTRTIALGTQNGIDYIDVTFAGTASGSGVLTVRFDGATDIAAASGQNWTESCFAAVSSTTGISSVVLRVDGLNSGGTATSDTQSSADFHSDTSFSRRSVGITLADPTTTNIRGIVTTNTVANGTVVNFAIRIGWPQLEQGVAATSPIRTTNAAATRAADIVRLNLPPSFGASHSLFAQGTPNQAISYGSDQYLSSISDGSSSNRFGLLRLASTGVPNWIINATKTGIGSTAMAQSSSSKIAAGNAVSDQGGSLNGGTVTNGTSSTSPNGLTRMEIGGDGTGALQFNGYVERVMCWPGVRLDDIVLAGLAAGTRMPGGGHVSMLDYGTTTNDDAATGHVGEFQSASATAVSLTTATPANLTSLALTAGDWDVEGFVKFNPAGTTTSTIRMGGLSQTSATLPTALETGTAWFRESGAITTGTGPVLATGTCRISLSVTTTIYLVGQATFATSTMTADGMIKARRVR